MRYISVCSGIEAASVAWHGLGWTPLAFSEVDAFPSAVLAAQWPDVPNLGDMTKFSDWPEDVLADCDLLVGGTPCQAFSIAGLRKSLDDSRGNLTLVYVQLWNRINEIRRSRGRSPAIALWENVPGVLSTKDNAFGCLLGGLLGCDEAPEPQDGKWHKAGFLSSESVRVGWRIIDAQFFGVAQRRRRVFVVAVPSELVGRFGDRCCPSEILSLRESLLGNPPPRGATWQGVAGDAARGSGEGGGRVTYPCIDASIDAEWGSNQWVDAGCPVFSKTLCGKQSRLDTETETLICFHPTQDTISNDQGVSHAIGTGSPQGQATSAVCFKPSHFTRGKDGSPSEVTPPLSADADKGDQDTVVAAPVALAVDTDNQTIGDVSIPVRVGNGKDSLPAVAVPMKSVGFSSKNDAGDAMDDIASTMRAMGHNSSHANGGGQLAVAVDVYNHTIDGGVAATLNSSSGAPNHSGPKIMEFIPFDTTQMTSKLNRSHPKAGDPMHPLAAGADAPAVVAFKESQSGCRTGDVHATIDSNKGSRRQEGVLTDMAVRRLTPRECERLQGFPDNYTAVTYRKKPAADGPRYKALGNSMAVPCMWWLGYRIGLATDTLPHKRPEQ